MCGSQDESLIHFLCECVELNEWRREMYGKEKLNVIWMVDRMKETNFLSIKRIARFCQDCSGTSGAFSLNSIKLF